jgi:adenylate cyclase
MTGLNLQLFGGFEARTPDGATLSFPTKKTKALLAYLAAHEGKSHSRSSLAGLLWGNSAEEQARASLRQTLAYLRKALAPTGREHLVVKDDVISVDAASVEVDAVVVENLAADGDPDGLERLCDLYQGEFLNGLDLREEEFNDWLRVEHARFHGLVTDSLRMLLAHREANDELTRGIRVANRLIEIDPIQEHAHRSLMRLYARQGERALALRQYEVCQEILKHEVDSEPDEETSQLWEEIRASRRDHGNGQDDSPSSALASTNLASGNPAFGISAPGDPPSVAEPPLSVDSHRPKRPGWALPAIFVVLAAAAALAAFQLARVDRGPAPGPEQSVARPGAVRAAIAVLPFDTMGDDREHDYFSDGITEDLITDLSRISGLFVIARNTMFTYKDQSVNIQELGRELQVRYILEGSVRRADGRIRINVQLVDAEGGHHLWSDRFDRELTSVFAVQDEITQKIVSALAVRLTEEEQTRIGQAAQVNPEAYDMLLRGLEAYRRYTPEENAEARELFERAIALDPGFARAHADLALTYYYDVVFGLSSRDESIRQAIYYAKTANELDGSLPQLQFALSDIYRMQGKHDDAIAAARRAVALDPNYADGYGVLSLSLIYAGEPDAGLEAIREAMRLNPRHPFFYVNNMGHAYFLKGRYEEAIHAFERVTERNPGFLPARLLLASAYGQIGRTEDAEWEVEEIITLSPDFSIAQEREWAQYRKPADLERYLEGLRKAGLPE